MDPLVMNLLSEQIFFDFLRLLEKDQKRQINLLNPQFLGLFIQEFEKLISK